MQSLSYCDYRDFFQTVTDKTSDVNLQICSVYSICIRKKSFAIKFKTIRKTKIRILNRLFRERGMADTKRGEGGISVPCVH